jgi:type IV secretory pathway TraG/TraD family ATPase VirD4
VTVGVYLGETARGPLLAGAEQGVLVLGPPRSGKTSALVVPNVVAASGPVVSTSTKSDVLAATVAARRRVGRCWLFDPSGTVARPDGVDELRWSPVPGSMRWDGAVLMARSMAQAARPATGVTPVEANHWNERAEALLAPLLHAAALAGEPIESLVGWVNRRSPDEAGDILYDHGSPTAADLLAGVVATDEREQSGIWSTASGVLVGYRLDAALASAAHPNFDPGAFVSGRDTIYVCATGRQQSLVAPLVVGLLEDVRAATYAKARPSSGDNVLLALDEVANIAPLPDLPAIVAEGGSQGLVTLACLQDFSQARARWGTAADGFASLFGATVVLRGIGDVRTLEALSARCGEVDVSVRSESRGRSQPDLGGRPWRRSRSVTWSTRRQRRLAVDDIAEGQPGAALVVAGAQAPMWVELRPWWERGRSPVTDHVPTRSRLVRRRVQWRAVGRDR